MLKATCTVLTLVLILNGCAAKKEAAEAEPVAPVEVALAERGAIDRTVGADALLYPFNQAGVTPKVSAPVRAFNVNRGDHVAAGQLLATLENRDLAASASESKGLYQQAEATYTATTAGTLPEEMLKSQQDVEAAKQTLDAAQKVYDSRKELLQQGALARKQVDDAAVALAQARSVYEVASKHMQSLQNVGQQAQMQGAAAALAAAKAHYQGSQAQLGYAEVKSPIAGIVADRPLYAGEMASAGTPLITVMDISRIVARANVPVAAAAGLRTGMPAAISAPGGEIHGKVTVISPAVDPNSTTLEVWVEAPNPGERLKPGSSARVEIVAETIHDAIVVSSDALLPSQEGGTSVFVVGADSTAHEKKVELGVRTADKVQILKGVNAGDRVVTVGGLGLQDNGKVRVRK